MSRYLLSKGVFLCRTDEHVVLLDLRHDKYFALDARGAAPLAGLVKGWPVKRFLDSSAVSQDDATSHAEALAAKGLLTMNPEQGKDAVPISLPPPVAEIVADAFDDGPTVRAPQAARFLLAALTAWLTLKLLPIDRVVARVKRRKEHRPIEQEPDLEAVRRLVNIFDRVRPFVFASDGACLFEALTLLNFLAQYDFFPTWTFGVHTGPFNAHCWVQYRSVSLQGTPARGCIVLNDTIERVRSYTPIMAV